MKEKVAVSKRLSENIAQMEEFFHECDDIKKKELMLGRQMDVACYLTFIEVSVDMGTSALSEVLKYLKGLGKVNAQLELSLQEMENTKSLLILASSVELVQVLALQELSARNNFRT